jgi:glutathione S-transferase
MALELYAHPFSSYCQKVLIALYENATPFTLQMLSPEHPENMAVLERHWPFKKFPLLVDAGTAVRESSIIIEHLEIFHPGTVRLIPSEPRAALEVRFLDRYFDNYISGQQQKLVFDALRPVGERDARGVAEARAALSAAYRWLNSHMTGRRWAAGDTFTLADCAAAPALFYADWSHPIPAELANVHAYRQRLLARPSYARAVDEARPYRQLFPLGAPDRD